MYIAELKGKLPTKIKRSEDILTSNVFSFFKYSNRSLYLSNLLSVLELSDVTEHELEEAKFIFWPKFDDNTEPDLVIIVGKYYLLFEAKYFSDFADETLTTKKQLQREIEGGLIESRVLKKKFIIIAITANSIKPLLIYKHIPIEFKKYFKWINWQSISKILLKIIEDKHSNIPNIHFAKDLFALLDSKKLRGFMTFEHIKNIIIMKNPKVIFFQANTALYRGIFIGFQTILSKNPKINTMKNNIFYHKTFFNLLPNLNKEYFTR